MNNTVPTGENPTGIYPFLTQLPKHVAIIMDGNGRWAAARNLSRSEGHKQGADAVKRAVEVCLELGIRYLTLYCFSSENWKRPQNELDNLMLLMETFMSSKRDELLQQGIRLKVIGRRDGIPQSALREMILTEQVTSVNDKLTLQLAINYGGRNEIVDAVKSIIDDVKSGNLGNVDIDERVISDHLYTSGIPDPDLLIRTAGELRISNFLLWQISYAEIWVTQTFWPDFDRVTFMEALENYSQRKRRFGAV